MSERDKRVNELVTQITLENWDRFKYLSYDIHKRDTEMITFLIRELAIERAKNEILTK
jgi:hypothetical protein